MTHKNVLITGASGGIGAELARRFALQGGRLALMARSREKLGAVTKECLGLGAARAEFFPCDLTEDEDVRRAVSEATESFGGTFDVVVLNAGRSMGCYFEEIQSMDDVNYMLKLNVNGVINTLMQALPAIPKAASSRIVIISSVSGVLGVPYRTIYCASKHALTGFANALRIELGDTYGVDAPKVQLVDFPEVEGTDLNAGRMLLGATRPPAQFKESGANNKLMTVETACEKLAVEIEAGTDQWGQSPKFKFLVLLKLLLGGVADSLVLKYVKKTHFRPDKQAVGNK